MSVEFREATRDDVPVIVAMLEDDMLGAARECKELAPYLAAFDRLQSENGNEVYVAVIDGTVVASYQITFISGLSLQAARRAQVESVRVVRAYRGQGIGRLVMEHAEARARAAGCTLMQLTSNKARARAKDFYRRTGYTDSHAGFKRKLG